ncbi:hypothetical protein BMG03_00995 [Thioclava nitratireducens]|uniref:Uncharacterized protein n=1 Tax=Thioclava nitratireducens TaxID=1915078 RepID=A0ABM6ICX8_9RHOB|nr:hypothetical protein [Thioclava nitratireducens]AQS46532.1 hypothetical protein BMG03_00995 [Thioclava nitratireducens]
MITFRPSYPGSPVENAYLGSVVVGGVHADGKRGAWYSALPTDGMQPFFWNRAESVEAARAALIRDIETWSLASGLAAVDTISSMAALVRIRKTLEWMRDLSRPDAADQSEGDDGSISDDFIGGIDFALGVLNGEEWSIRGEVPF